MRALRDDRGVSLSQMSFATAEETRLPTRYTGSFISKVERGEKAPPPDLLILYGLILKASIEELPEAHLAFARRQFDEDAVGYTAAIKNLESLEAAEAAGQLRVHPPDYDLLRRELVDDRPAEPGKRSSETSASPQRKRRAKKRAA